MSEACSLVVSEQDKLCCVTSHRLSDESCMFSSPLTCRTLFSCAIWIHIDLRCKAWVSRQATHMRLEFKMLKLVHVSLLLRHSRHDIISLDSCHDFSLSV